MSADPSHSRCALQPNAQVQLQASQIKAPGEARRNQKIAWQLQRSLGVGEVQTGYIGNSSNREHGIHSVATARIAHLEEVHDAVAGDESCGPTIAVYRRLSQ